LSPEREEKSVGRCGGRGGDTQKFSVLEGSQAVCPLVLLVEVRLIKGNALGNEEGKGVKMRTYEQRGESEQGICFVSSELIF
jgi:hypothetical protein